MIYTDSHVTVRWARSGPQRVYSEHGRGPGPDRSTSRGTGSSVAPAGVICVYVLACLVMYALAPRPRRRPGRDELRGICRPGCERVRRRRTILVRDTCKLQGLSRIACTAVHSLSAAYTAKQSPQSISKCTAYLAPYLGCAGAPITSPDLIPGPARPRSADQPRTAQRHGMTDLRCPGVPVDVFVILAWWWEGASGNTAHLPDGGRGKAGRKQSSMHTMLVRLLQGPSQVPPCRISRVPLLCAAAVGALSRGRLEIEPPVSVAGGGAVRTVACM